MAGLDYKLTSRRTHRARGSMRVRGGDGGKTNVLEGAFVDDERLLQVRPRNSTSYELRVTSKRGLSMSREYEFASTAQWGTRAWQTCMANVHGKRAW